jgi:hypothetical protein
MHAEELSPSRGLDSKAQSCIQCKASNDEKHLVVIGLQTESTGKVAAMVVARIEHKLERLGIGDECWVVSNVVQNGLRTQRHHKEIRTERAHCFARVLGCPSCF